MTGSPDLSPYVDLQLIDRDPQDIVDVAIQHLQATFPEFEPREGQMEMVLIEAAALEAAESIFAINRMPDAMTEVLLSFFDITRDIGQQPITDITFRISGDQGATIPAGSTYVLDIANGLDPLILTTDNELVIPAGSTTGTMTAIGDQYTDMFNGVPAGTLLQPQDTNLYVDYASLGSDITEGRDPETDQEYLSRGVQQMQRLTSTLTVPSQFQAAASEYVYVARTLALDAYNPDNDPDGNGPVGNDVGYMTVAVYGDNENVSDDRKASMVSDFEASCNANLIVKVIDPTITPVDVSVVVALDANADAATVVNNVTTALEGYLSPMTWPWGSVVRRSSLLSLISNVEGVDYVDTLATPAADVTLNGVAPLATLGQLTINTI